MSKFFFISYVFSMFLSKTVFAFLYYYLAKESSTDILHKCGYLYAFTTTGKAKVNRYFFIVDLKKEGLNITNILLLYV